ncbi:putative membrane protein [Knoellia remsis]|uniref:Putative membrane protein n=1 Tax=Knoellia remsis TaxID=407159 RepID=A0A2T0UJU9_9MICO|nr:DUF2254 domain-containing protein [Knoellia remsis]PRY58107.1 putative membrane protein [Knoellia remsis]
MSAPSDSREPRRAVGPLGDPTTIGWWGRIWQPFWVLPSVICAAAFALSLVLPEVDRRLLLDQTFLFNGNAGSARSLLGTIASAMISVTGLVFSITMVVMQLASSQFTPRLLGDFLRSRIVQVTLGVFTSSFLFALVVLRSVRGGDDGPEFVPQLSVTFAFVLVLASVALFFAFIHHITQSIQVDRTIDRIQRTTAAELGDGWPDDTDDEPQASWEPDERPYAISARDRHGIVERVELGAIVRAAEKAGVVVELTFRPGDVVFEDQPIARVHRGPGGGAPDVEALADAVHDAITLGRTRTVAQDPQFGVRQLVDIAERALSPGINDPTTAVQVLDELHRLLRAAVQRPDVSPLILDGSGVVRVVDRPLPFADLLDLALDEIAHYGADDIQVPRRIDELLADLLTVARPEHRPTLAAKQAELAGARR